MLAEIFTSSRICPPPEVIIVDICSPWPELEFIVSGLLFRRTVRVIRIISVMVRG